MNDEETGLVEPAGERVATRDEDLGPPALSEADRLAAGVVAVLDKLAESIPGLRPIDPEVARRARGARTVSPEFVSSMIALVDRSPDLQSLQVFDSDKARRVLQSRDPYRVIAERLEMLLAVVNHTKEAEWAEVAGAAMDAYRMAATFAEQPPNRHLIPHLKILRRHLHRTSGPRRKKADKPDPETK